MQAAKNFYVSSLTGFAQLHSHKELGMIRNWLLCCACLPAKLQPAWSAGRKKKNQLRRCRRDRHHRGDAHMQQRPHARQGITPHHASFLLTVLPANPPQKRFLSSPSWLCSAGAELRAAAYPELSSTSKASWGLQEKNPSTHQSHEKRAPEPETQQCPFPPSSRG